ncbi:hypothetical protein AB6A40_006069 [Gnathostoma spinigerum]|uniref:Tumor protein D52 n=1 Tax=Gnathostoma spinigerum TaxID=75299 RepID=A0ABD6EIF8_9BILA
MNVLQASSISARRVWRLQESKWRLRYECNSSRMKKPLEKFLAELSNDSEDDSTTDSSEKDSLNKRQGQATKKEKDGGDLDATIGGTTDLSEAEKEVIREELRKTEAEIITLRQVLAARQKHAVELKRKLGISPLSELTSDINQSIQHVKELPAYQKTSEVVADTAETVKNKWHDMRNSSLFKSFESKLGSAYTTAKMAASTSIDQISSLSRPSQGASSHTSPTSPSGDKSPLA